MRAQLACWSISKPEPQRWLQTSQAAGLWAKRRGTNMDELTAASLLISEAALAHTLNESLDAFKHIPGLVGF